MAKGPVIFAFVPVILVAYHVLYRRPSRARGFPISIPSPGTPGEGEGGGSPPNPITAATSEDPHPDPPPEYRRRGKAWTPHLTGIALFLLIALPWFIAVFLSVDHALELWRYESVGSFADNTEKARGWWFYLPALLQIALPWTPVWFMGLVFAFFRFKPRRLFALVSMVLILIIFSLSNVKKNAYLLPMMPIQTLIIAQGLLWLTIIFRKRGPAHRPVRVPMIRATIAAVALCFAIQIFLSGYLTWVDNHRSAKDACRLVMRMLAEPGNQSLLVSQLPEEASIYLPLGLRDSTTSNEVLMIVDDRKGEGEMIARQVKTTPSGAVRTIEQVPLPNPRTDRWKVFKLIVKPPSPAPASAPTPASGPAQVQPDTPAPATSSSESPASRGSS
jgi:hypothetical protein